MLNMNPEVRKLWIEALRSGTYSQTHGILEDKDGFCCLGVLSKLAADRDICKRTIDKETGAIFYDESNEFLPYSVRQWAGLDFSNPVVTLTYETLYGSDKEEPAALEQVTLVTLNDDFNFTFRQIADAIEGKLT